MKTILSRLGLSSLLVTTLLWTACQKTELGIPPSISDQSVSIDMDNLSSFADTVKADANSNKLIYSIIGGDAKQLFSIDSLSGVISLANVSDFKMDSSTEYELTVKIYSSANYSLSATAKIYIKVHLNVPEGGLVSYFAFNGDTYDSTNNYNGESHNVQYVADRFGNMGAAVSFNGYSSYVKVPSTYDLPQRTFSYWFKSYDQPYEAFYERVIFASDNPALKHGITNTAIMKTSKGDNVLDMNGVGLPSEYISYKLNSWNHVVIVLNGSDRKFYLNGVQVYTDTVDNLYTSVDGYPATFFGCSRSIDSFYKGDIDQVRIYNRPLSYKEVLGLYHEK